MVTSILTILAIIVGGIIGLIVLFKFLGLIWALVQDTAGLIFAVLAFIMIVGFFIFVK